MFALSSFGKGNQKEWNWLGGPKESWTFKKERTGMRGWINVIDCFEKVLMLVDSVSLAVLALELQVGLAPGVPDHFSFTVRGIFATTRFFLPDHVLPSLWNQIPASFSQHSSDFGGCNVCSLLLHLDSTGCCSFPYLPTDQHRLLSAKMFYSHEGELCSLVGRHTARTQHALSKASLLSLRLYSLFTIVLTNQKYGVATIW